MAGKFCQVIVPILLRADSNTTELQSKNILVLWFYNVMFPDWEIHSWQHAEKVERVTVISLISPDDCKPTEKGKVKIPQWLFFFAEEPGRGTFAVGTIADLQLTWGSSGVIPKSSMCKESICVLFSPDHSASKRDAKERKCYSIITLHWRQQGYFRRQQAWY